MTDFGIVLPVVLVVMLTIGFVGELTQARKHWRKR